MFGYIKNLKLLYLKKKNTEIRYKANEKKGEIFATFKYKLSILVYKQSLETKKKITSIWHIQVTHKRLINEL